MTGLPVTLFLDHSLKPQIESIVEIELTGPPKFSSTSLHAYHVLFDPGRPSRTSPITIPLCWLLNQARPSPSAFMPLSGLYQTSGSAVSPTVYVVLCVRFNCFVRLHFCFLLHSCNTRYEWLDKPYSARTSTSQEVPSLLGAQPVGLQLGPSGRAGEWCEVWIVALR